MKSLQNEQVGVTGPFAEQAQQVDTLQCRVPELQFAELIFKLVNM